MASVDLSRSARRTTGVWRLIRSLIGRPARTDRTLPVVWLVRPADAAPVLETLAERFANAPGGKVPHVRLAAEAREPAGIDQLLVEICAGLGADRFGVRPLQFPRFFLATYLMSQDLSGVPVDERRRDLIRRLRRRRSPRGGDQATEPAAESWYGTGSQLLSWLVRRVVPTALFRIWASSRVPLAGNPYRWFLRQQYLAPRQARSFAGFAVRLTAGLRGGEVPTEVDKLLVHAFLEDLRYEYRRRPWRLAGWRRTAYPVVLLAGVRPGTAAGELLGVIAEVRNETGQWDPLLVVCTAEEPPPGVAPLPGDNVEDIEDGFDVWQETLPQKRRVLDRTAWFLPVDLPDPPGTPVTIRAPRVPWFARRTTAMVAVAALLAAGAGYAGQRWGWDLHCLPKPFAGQSEVRLIGGQCIGYSDSNAFTFGNDETLRSIQERIFAQNAEVDEQIAKQPRRPRATLVYLGTLTGRQTPRDVEPYVAEREELEGMAVAQYARMKADSTELALLRIVIANGGFEMRYSHDAVGMLAGLVADDPTVLGVVGLVESRTNTARALARLNQLGLLAVAPTLSADRFYENSRLYLQIAPPNLDQAKLIAGYARDVLKVGAVHAYYTTGSGNPVETLADDRYVDTLIDDLRQELGPLLQRMQPYEGQSALAGECTFRGMLLFAGRWTEFEGFVTALRACGENPPFHLVADDSVNRYMANTRQRRNAPALPLAFVSKATLASCERLAAASGERRVFYDLIRRADLLPQRRCDPAYTDPDTGAAVPVGERVALAYDATAIVANAVDSLASRLRNGGSARAWRPDAINSVAVHAEVLRLHTVGVTQGVTGLIRFDTDTGEPVGKRVSLVEVGSIRISGVNGTAAEQPAERYFCQQGERDTETRCTTSR